MQTYTGGTDDVPGPDTNPAGVNALPAAPEQDQQMAKIEADVLEVLADEPMAPEASTEPVAGTSSSSASRPPLPRLRGKGQGQGTPATAPVTGSFLEPDDGVDRDLKYSGKGKSVLVRENAKQYTLHHITGHRYYYEYEDNHGYPWEWCCSWPKHVRRGISGLLRGHVPDISIYDPACYLPVYKLLQLAKAKFPDYADTINLFELISMLV